VGSIAFSRTDGWTGEGAASLGRVCRSLGCSEFDLKGFQLS